MDFLQTIIEFFIQYGWAGIIALATIGGIFLLVKHMDNKGDEREHDLINQVVKSNENLTKTILDSNKDLTETLVSTLTNTVTSINNDINKNVNEIEHKLIDTLNTTITTHYQDKEQEHRDSQEHRFNITKDVSNKLFNMMKQFNSQRATIIELHNGGVNLNGLSFIGYDVTHEKTDKNVAPLMHNMQGIPTSTIHIIFEDIIKSKHNVVIYHNDDIHKLHDRGATTLYYNLTNIRNVDHVVYSGIFNDFNVLYGLVILDYQTGRNTFKEDIVTDIEVAKATLEISQMYKYVKKFN